MAHVVTHQYTDGTTIDVCSQHEDRVPSYSRSGASYSGDCDVCERVEAVPMGARYHVESYGPGRTYYSWGDPLPLDEVKRHPGPEGWLQLRRDGDEWVVDVLDDECPAQLDGRCAPGGVALVDETGEVAP